MPRLLRIYCVTARRARIASCMQCIYNLSNMKNTMKNILIKLACYTCSVTCLACYTNTAAWHMSYLLRIHHHATFVILVNYMSVDVRKSVFIKKYYENEIIFHIYIKHYRTFELSNITRIMHISNTDYTPVSLIATD